MYVYADISNKFSKKIFNVLGKTNTVELKIIKFVVFDEEHCYRSCPMNSNPSIVCKLRELQTHINRSHTPATIELMFVYRDNVNSTSNQRDIYFHRCNLNFSGHRRLLMEFNVYVIRDNVDVN